MCTACSDGSLGPKASLLGKAAESIQSRVHEGGGEAPEAAAPTTLTGTAEASRETGSFIVGGASGEELLLGLSDDPVDVELSFEDADIKEVVTTILGDVLRREFTLDPLLNRKVSLNTGRGLSARSLVMLLNDAVIEAGGRMTRKGELFQIVALPGQGSRVAELSRANPTVTFVPLRYTQAFQHQGFAAKRVSER